MGRLDETLSEMYDQRLFQQHNPCAPIIKTLQQHGTPMLRAFQDSFQQQTINFNSSTSINNITSNDRNVEGRNDDETKFLQKCQERSDSTNLPWKNYDKDSQQLQHTVPWEVVHNKEHLKNIQENLFGLLKLHNLKRLKPTSSLMK